MPYFCCTNFVQIFNFRLKSHRYALNLLSFVVGRHIFVFVFVVLKSNKRRRASCGVIAAVLVLRHLLLPQINSIFVDSFLKCVCMYLCMHMPRLYLLLQFNNFVFSASSLFPLSICLLIVCCGLR